MSTMSATRSLAAEHLERTGRRGAPRRHQARRQRDQRQQGVVQLIRIGLEHPGIRFEILYGVSDNAASWWDNSRAHALGYRPKGKAEDHRAHAEAEQAKIGPDPVGDLFQGGTFCASEFTNDVKRAGP